MIEVIRFWKKKIIFYPILHSVCDRVTLTHKHSSVDVLVSLCSGTSDILCYCYVAVG